MDREEKKNREQARREDLKFDGGGSDGTGAG